MSRKWTLVLAAVVVAVLVDARPSAAAPVSLNNPYRSFNLSGVNYGSMRWEQQHRGRVGRQGWSHRGGGFLFRRR